VSEGFVLLSSRLLLWSMFPLVFGIATVLLALYGTLWFLLPHLTRAS
jgi:hypothetical protein